MDASICGKLKVQYSLTDSEYKTSWETAHRQVMRVHELLKYLLLIAFLWPLSAAADPLDIGRPAGAEDITRWNIDVGPDGVGLPPGGGTAQAGEPIYATRCAACHGPTGRKGRDWLASNPSMHGQKTVANTARKTIGNYWPYATTLFDYIRRAMPPEAPGSLSDDVVYALTAHLLHLNGIIAVDEEMNAKSLPQVKMPARERFVPDDRRGGAEVR